MYLEYAEVEIASGSLTTPRITSQMYADQQQPGTRVSLKGDGRIALFTLLHARYEG